MKRKISILLILILVVSGFLTACNKDSDILTYQVNSGDTIYIGALLPISGDYKSQGEFLSDGILFAQKTAENINIDKDYKIELLTKDITDLDSAYTEFVNKKVSGVICCGTDKATTDSIITKFKDTSIPLIFTDNYSSGISESKTAFSIAISDFYKASCMASHLDAENLRKGAVLILDDDPEKQTFADMLAKSAESSGIVVTKYFASGENANYKPQSIVSMDYEFICIDGSVLDSLSAVKSLREQGFLGEVIISEVADKTMLENDCNGIAFINKFDYDDDNYIGSDFLNVYGNNADISSAVAYGYDAYLLMYQALLSFAKDSGAPLTAVKNNSNDGNTEDTVITTKDLIKSLHEITYYGVTDTISFDDNGITKVNFLYVHEIQGDCAVMLNKFKYSN